jgi:hypothetical protein
MTLPPGCTSGCGTAIANGSYPEVFNNDTVYGSFGITSKIFLDELTPSGTPVNSIEVPNRTQNGVPATKDQMVTSFSSKSELALNLSTDGQDITFMGYLAPVNAIDVSNSNTPGVVDPTNPVPSSYYRVVADVDSKGKFSFTKTNAYSGNNGRAAILNSDANVLYTAGNAGNGGDPQPDGVITGAGAQLINPEVRALVAQKPGDPTPVGSFNITQLGDPTDKREGHELPRPDDLRQRRLLHQEQRWQRRQHAVLHRHDRHGLPQRHRRAIGERVSPDVADRLRRLAPPVGGRGADEHVHPQGLPEGTQVEDVVPVRDLVRQPDRALRRRRRKR